MWMVWVAVPLLLFFFGMAILQEAERRHAAGTSGGLGTPEDRPVGTTAQSHRSGTVRVPPEPAAAVQGPLVPREVQWRCLVPLQAAPRIQGR